MRGRGGWGRGVDADVLAGVWAVGVGFAGGGCYGGAVGLKKWSEDFECGYEDFVNCFGGEGRHLVHGDGDGIEVVR